MDLVRFDVIPVDLATGPVEVLLPVVNGTPLPQLVQRAQDDDGRRRGAGGRAQRLAGAGHAYQGLCDDRVRWPGRHFLGEPVLRAFPDDDSDSSGDSDDSGGGAERGRSTVLLGCTCLEWSGCSFSADVVVDDRRVTWSGYRQREAGTVLLGLRDLHFDRGGYERALAATAVDQHSPYR